MSSSSLIAAIRDALGCQDGDPPLIAGPPPADVAESLAAVFARCRDLRGRKGLRHQLPSALATLTLAIACGTAEIDTAATTARGWDQDVLAALGARRNPHTGLLEAPSASTLGRRHKAVDVVALQADLTRWTLRWALGAATPLPVFADPPPPVRTKSRQRRATRADALRQERADGWVAAAPRHPFLDPTVLVDPAHRPARAAVAVDGKERRGARRGGGRKVHLLAAITHHTGLVLGQERIARAGKANEVSHFVPLLAPLPLTDVLITSDAMQTTHPNARFIRTVLAAHYLFPVLGNQPTPKALLDGLDRANAPVVAATVETGHGRIETRTLQVLPVPDGLELEGPAQVLLVERYTTYWKNGQEHTRAEAVLHLTSLGSADTSPADLLAHLRGHWSVENLHWLRDVVWEEDRSLPRTGDSPELMSILTNLVITLFRILGVTKFKEETSRNHQNPHRALQIMLL